MSDFVDHHGGKAIDRRRSIEERRHLNRPITRLTNLGLGCHCREINWLIGAVVNRKPDLPIFAVLTAAESKRLVLPPAIKRQCAQVSRFAVLQCPGEYESAVFSAFIIVE